MIIEVREDPSGEWVELVVDGREYHVGHSIPAHVYHELLRRAGVVVQKPEGAFDDGGGWVPCP